LYFCTVGKNKLKRFEENAAFENLFQPAVGFPPPDFKFKGQWRSLYFKNNNPIVLELGCGRAEYTIGLAAMHPQCNYIGIDIKGARMWRGAKTALENGWKHVAFVRTQMHFIEKYFAPNEVSEIWITFPDPQPQESRARKRLTAPNYLNYYKNICAPDAILHLKTDNKPLYDYTLETLPLNGFKIIDHQYDIYAKEKLKPELTIKTTYEQLFEAKGEKICYIKFGLA
jgi:tRNA (guanine-N7-)-methyltransferase